MIAVGIDPDTTTTGVAVVELVGNRMIVRGVALVRAKGRKVQDRLVGMASELAYVFRDGIRLDLQDVEPDAVAVEWQRLRPRGEKNPNSIVDLNGVAGMCVSTALQLFGNPTFNPTPNIFTPIPPEWKKQVPKKVHQNRILRRVGLAPELTYGDGSVVPGAKKIPASMRTHVIDAIGLAVWALEPLGPLHDARIKAEIKARK